jgi:hypothetical protein
MTSNYNLKTKKHMIKINKGKPMQLEEDRLTEIDKQNRILFGQIQEIMDRKNYKMVQSRKNPLKMKKKYFMPGDQGIKNGGFIGGPSYSLDVVKQNQRELRFKEMHNENLSVLNRIQNAKPTDPIEKF